MKIRMDEDPFAKNVQSNSKIYHEVLMFKKIFQTKPRVKNMTIIYYDLYYTVIKNRDEKEIVDNQYENDYNNFNDIVPNHKPHETTLRERKLRSQKNHFKLFILYK